MRKMSAFSISIINMVKICYYEEKQPNFGFSVPKNAPNHQFELTNSLERIFTVLSRAALGLLYPSYQFIENFISFQSIFFCEKDDWFCLTQSSQENIIKLLTVIDIPEDGVSFCEPTS